MSAAKKAMSAAKHSKALTMGRLRGYQVPDVPHLEPEALDYFRSRVLGGTLYMEYGSGGSTLLAGRAGAHVISVESDRYYHRSVCKRVAAVAADVDAHLIHADIGLTREWGRPVVTRPTARRVAAWTHYLEVPWEHPGRADRTPDVVLVDGRFRVAAALTCLRHLVGCDSSEILFDDYVGRPHYHAVENFMPLVRTVGRMGVFRPVSTELDRLSQAIDEYKVDWR